MFSSSRRSGRTSFAFFATGWLETEYLMFLHPSTKNKKSYANERFFSLIPIQDRNKKKIDGNEACKYVVQDFFFSHTREGTRKKTINASGLSWANENSDLFLALSRHLMSSSFARRLRCTSTPDRCIIDPNFTI